jgi:cytochrome c oxidase subunit 3
MSTYASPVVKTNRPNLVAVGTIVWLSSELMFFAALFAMYFTTRAVQGPKVWAESTELLNIPFAATNTTSLPLSVFKLAVREACGNLVSGECGSGLP